MSAPTSYLHLRFLSPSATSFLGLSSLAFFSLVARRYYTLFLRSSLYHGPAFATLAFHQVTGATGRNEQLLYTFSRIAFVIVRARCESRISLSLSLANRAAANSAKRRRRNDARFVSWFVSWRSWRYRRAIQNVVDTSLVKRHFITSSSRRYAHNPENSRHGRDSIWPAVRLN